MVVFELPMFDEPTHEAGLNKFKAEDQLKGVQKKWKRVRHASARRLQKYRDDQDEEEFQKLLRQEELNQKQNHHKNYFLEDAIVESASSSEVSGTDESYKVQVVETVLKMQDGTHVIMKKPKQQKLTLPQE